VRSSANGRSAFASVLRRCVKMDRTKRTKCPRPASTPPPAGTRAAEPRNAPWAPAETRRGGSGQHPPHVRVQLDEDRQRSVVLRPRPSFDAIRDFSLHHDGRVAQGVGAAAGFQQLEQDRRRDVVGKIAGDAERPALEQAAQDRSPENPAGSPSHLPGNRNLDRLDHAAIDFDRGELGDPRRQSNG